MQDLPGPVNNWSMTGVYMDGATGWLIDQNVIWNARYAIQLNGSGRLPPNNNTVIHNSIIDVAPRATIFLNEIPTCGITRIADNRMMLAVQQEASACAVGNNGPSAPGAYEMSGSVAVGCDFAGCSSSGPPAISGDVVGASIFMPPAAARIEAGETATFVAAGAGSPPLRYQWARNGIAIAGASAATYQTPPLAAADDGASYTVTVENPLGSAISPPASVSVKPGAADCLFDWAERAYAATLAPAGAASQVLEPYYFRHYRASDSYVGVSTADGHVYYLAGGVLNDSGPVSLWYAAGGCR